MQAAGSAMKRTGAAPLSEVMRMKAVGPYLFPRHPDVAASPSFLPVLQKTFVTLTAYTKISFAISSGCFLHSNYLFLYWIKCQQFTSPKLTKALGILF